MVGCKQAAPFALLPEVYLTWAWHVQIKCFRQAQQCLRQLQGWNRQSRPRQQLHTRQSPALHLWRLPALRHQKLQPYPQYPLVSSQSIHGITNLSKTAWACGQAPVPTERKLWSLNINACPELSCLQGGRICQRPWTAYMCMAQGSSEFSLNVAANPLPAPLYQAHVLACTTCCSGLA